MNFKRIQRGAGTAKSLLMERVTFRFYAELNDFLSPEQRMRAFAHALLLPASVKDVIESLGVPHTEVELILANGVPVEFSYLALGFTAPIIAVMVPFCAYYHVNGMVTFVYFFFGGFAVAMFTNILYCRLTYAERKARGETFGQHCRTVAGWPTASILCSWFCGYVFYRLFYYSLLG